MLTPALPRHRRTESETDMDDNMYDEEPAQGQGEEQGEAPPEKDADEGEGQTALLPRSILAGKTFKPGDELVLKVDEIRGEEIVVSYASSSDHKDGGGMDEEGKPADSIYD